MDFVHDADPARDFEVLDWRSSLVVEVEPGIGKHLPSHTARVRSNVQVDFVMRAEHQAIGADVTAAWTFQGHAPVPLVFECLDAVSNFEFGNIRNHYLFLGIHIGFT